MKILIIDDCYTIARLLEYYLEGFEVDIALSGVDGLKKFDNHDLVFVDVNLGDMKGYDVAQIISKFSEVKIIGMSASAPDSDEFNYFIRKPLKMKSIKEAIDSVL